MFCHPDVLNRPERQKTTSTTSVKIAKPCPQAFRFQSIAWASAATRRQGIAGSVNPSKSSIPIASAETRRQFNSGKSPRPPSFGMVHQPRRRSPRWGSGARCGGFPVVYTPGYLLTSPWDWNAEQPGSQSETRNRSRSGNERRRGLVIKIGFVCSG